MAQINKLASIWADALISRDGHPRYEMMSAAMKEQFKQEQAARSGENWNYNIGVPSPWAADYEIRIKGKTQESLTFAVEDGGLVIAEYYTVYEDRPGSADFNI